VNPILASALTPELTGGRYPAPAWLILTLGGVVIAAAIAYLVIRFRRRADKDRR
jgi:hypothetical protein